MYLQIFEINEISSDFNEITEINGFLSDFKSRTGFWGMSDPSVIYDVENKGLCYFPSDENKGLKSIAEICCSVIKSLITDSMASIRLVT